MDAILLLIPFLLSLLLALVLVASIIGATLLFLRYDDNKEIKKWEKQEEIYDQQFDILKQDFLKNPSVFKYRIKKYIHLEGGLPFYQPQVILPNGSVFNIMVMYTDDGLEKYPSINSFLYTFVNSRSRCIEVMKKFNDYMTSKQNDYPENQISYEEIN